MLPHFTAKETGAEEILMAYSQTTIKCPAKHSTRSSFSFQTVISRLLMQHLRPVTEVYFQENLVFYWQ